MNSTFDQPLLLDRPKLGSRLAVGLILAMTTAGLTWAATAQIEQAVPAIGKLEPQGAVQEVKAPTGGVVREIFVQDGATVKKGQRLLAFDPTIPKADLQALNQLKSALLQENDFYTAAINGQAAAASQSELAPLVRLRSTLMTETQYLQAQLAGLNPQSSPNDFDANQQTLLVASRAETRSRIAAAQLQIQVLEAQRQQAQAQFTNAQQTVQLNQEILDRVKPLVETGALSQLQYQRQAQEVLTRRSEASRFQLEQQRLQVQMAQAEEEVNHTIATSSKELLSQIASNQKQIAEIDTQLSKARLENQKKLAELDTQLSKTQVALQYQELRAPVDGVVFNLQPHAAGFVANPSQALLKIVPADRLVAAVYLTNQDIGFIKPGMDVDIKVESFPEREFGSLTGKLKSIGSDALAPTPERPYYAFPARIQLDQQAFAVQNKPLPLQSGMAVNCSIKIRKRTVLSLLTDLFESKVKSLESVR